LDTANLLILGWSIADGVYAETAVWLVTRRERAADREYIVRYELEEDSERAGVLYRAQDEIRAGQTAGAR
jgi:hypothetical protein